MKTSKQYLFCPGPVNIASNVKKATIANEIGHREPEFSTLLRNVNRKLLEAFEVRTKKLYHPVLITGSGTAANEAILASAIGNRSILIISNGEFGERLIKISELHNKKTKSIKFAWAEQINLEKIEKFIEKNKIEVLMMVHHETSSGMLNPIDRVGAMTKRLGVRFIVDAVSSAGVEKIDLENWNISFCTTSSGKALGSLPGLGIIIGRVSDFNELAKIKSKSIYLDLYNLYKYSRFSEQTPNTPAVQLVFALDQALTNILTVGVKNNRDHIHEMTKMLRKEMKQMGFTFLIDEEYMCSMLTTVVLPDSIKIDSLRSELRKKNMIVYSGKGPFLNQVFQVGNIGNINTNNAKLFLKTLGMAKKLITNGILKSKRIPVTSPTYTYETRRINQ